MQKIQRHALVEAQIAGGAAKGSANGASTGTATLDASGLTVPAGSTVTIDVSANSSATAHA